MKNYQIKIYQRAEEEMNNWPKDIKQGMRKYWRHTLQDDKRGLISSLPFRLAYDCKAKYKNDYNYLYNLGLINLLLWTAANIQDDLSDEDSPPKQYLFLSNTCLITAQKIIWSIEKQNKSSSGLWQKILLTVEEANFKELSRPRIISKSDLKASHKSLFMLLSSLLLIKSRNWSQKNQDFFLLAGKYFLAAKQIADDVYDFREDWQNNRRNFAHRRLRKLPQGKSLTLYYQKQAKKIMALCEKCRQNMKKISTLKKGDCFDDYLEILEKNCQRAFTN